MARMLLALLLMGLCCGGPLLLLAFTSFLWGLFTAKEFFMVLAALLLCGGAAYAVRKRPRRPVTADRAAPVPTALADGLRVSTLYVPTVHCDGCIETLRTQLVRVRGVRSVDGLAEQKTLTVVYEATETDPPEIVRAVERALLQ